MKISVIGVGYLGAVHATCMADIGHSVIGVDTDADKVARLNTGKPTFYEPELEPILKRNIENGRLRFTQDMTEVVDCDLHFIAVGTPQVADGNAADMRYVDAVVESLLAVLPAQSERSIAVVGKSTVPVGTAARLQERFAGHGIPVVWNPEFLREGFAVKDTLRPDRIVYGLPDDVEDADTARTLLDECYADLLAAKIPKVETDFATAELVKVAANAFLATKISFINAMSVLTDATGGDVKKLAEAIGYDDRIGKKFLRAGIGFGGGCLPKDIRAFMSRADELGHGDALAFLHDVDDINTRQRERAVEKLREALGGELSGKKIGVLGAAFKPDSDDIRDSPAVDIAGRVEHAGATVVTYDPKAGEVLQKFKPERVIAVSLEDAVRDADAVMVLTEWKVFQDLDPSSISDLVNTRIVIDGRNCLDPKRWRDAGWTYVGMGRK
ncbi:UDP-glucose dehydrogenase family protein [Gulosibacter bifidus]|uniref:UDP-glucose 6-dehydrogenase n=1 Tax=Gulosibacter bifidus TaxID=272239 RepID=A0ABW5RI17_9MICO|nr:UDP-glucose/GDP-mannose dehydrogenase family protein [Gulosibacter bifidus]